VRRRGQHRRSGCDGRQHALASEIQAHTRCAVGEQHRASATRAREMRAPRAIGSGRAVGTGTRVRRADFVGCVRSQLCRRECSPLFEQHVGRARTDHNLVSLAASASNAVAAPVASRGVLLSATSIFGAGMRPHSRAQKPSPTVGMPSRLAVTDACVAGATLVLVLISVLGIPASGVGLAKAANFANQHTTSEGSSALSTYFTLLGVCAVSSSSTAATSSACQEYREMPSHCIAESVRTANLRTHPPLL
jgi:hypothetical protein